MNPSSFTVEEAIVAYKNAQSDRALKTRMESCTTRSNLAEPLSVSSQYKIDPPEDSMIVLADEYSEPKQHVVLKSVLNWAADKYEIGIQRVTQDANKVDEKLKGVHWENVTIKIWKDYKIGYSFEKGKYKRSSFQKIGLMGKNQKKPNKLGRILIILSQKEDDPAGTENCIYVDEKAAISRLKKKLLKLIPLSDDDPFHRPNPHEGYKPRFTLIYDVDNADERAKKKAEDTMVSLDGSSYKRFL